jgi:hypothetical protein
MEHFVTLFDSLFLPQGLALHLSMERHVKEYTLWILCVDDDAHAALAKLQLPNVRLLQLSSLETEDLLRVKPTRSKGEYCWTLTPFSPRFVFEADINVKRVTYLDADFWFRKHPKPIFDEFDASGKHVLITDHAYAPEYDQSAKSGQYCVQFMIFTRQGGEVVRKWWEDRCIEWCFNRFEAGKFGDQKYLDCWPIIFSSNVHVLNNFSAILAPWNVTAIPYGRAIAVHFHGLRILNGRTIWLSSGKYLPKIVVEQVYLLYCADLHTSIFLMRQLGIVIKAQVVASEVFFSSIKRFINFLIGLYRQMFPVTVLVIPKKGV